jgi:phosphoserine aminotransferase
VLQQASAAVLELNGTGMSVLEISHRSKEYEAIQNDASERLLRLLGLDASEYSVLFLGGGASLQFYMLALNLLASGRTAAYIDTGVWSTKAIEQARRVGHVAIAASSADAGYACLPDGWAVSADAAYLHVTSNNTIEGTQWPDIPDVADVAVIADLSSDFLARRRRHDRLAMMYAGAQKNVGPAGVTVVVIRNALLATCAEDVPEMLSYRVHHKQRSVYNTPPVFGVYVVGLVCRWIEERGGVDAMDAAAAARAKMVYEALDRHPDVYEPTVIRKEHRSAVNVTFRLRDPGREEAFHAGARAGKMVGLKGHRAVGGFRASMYNAFERAWAERFAEYLDAFARA